MDERTALSMIDTELEPAGDDAAVIDGQVLTTDMLHESTDFPPGTDRYTAGWRAVGASLSDVAAMGAEATAAVAVYGAPSFDGDAIQAFIRGAVDVCDRVSASYVGGDLDTHREFTVASTALGTVDDPVFRHGAVPGDAVCVTGMLGRSAAALDAFDRGDIDRGNELFRFTPRVEPGLTIGPVATAMMDSSDGLVRSLHQLADASSCGFAVEADRLPIADDLYESTDDHQSAVDRATTFGEDFELVCTIPEPAVADVRREISVPLSVIGRVVETGVTIDGEPVEDVGYTHGTK